jgi:hypothetical protein
VVTTYPNAVQSAEELREHAQSRVSHQNRSLYQINTRVSLRDLFQKRGRPATLDDFLDSELDRLAGVSPGYGFLECGRRALRPGKFRERGYHVFRVETV